MLCVLFRVLVLIIFGLIARDISQTESFNKSQTYQFLKEKKIIENAEVFMHEARKSYNKASVWAVKNIPVYYNETCTYLQPYFNVSQDLFLAFKKTATSFIQHTGIYIDKNFPAFQNYVSIVVKDSLTLAKEGAVVVFKQLQNYAEILIQYAKDMFSQR